MKTYKYMCKEVYKKDFTTIGHQAKEYKMSNTMIKSHDPLLKEEHTEFKKVS